MRAEILWHDGVELIGCRQNLLVFGSLAQFGVLKELRQCLYFCTAELVRKYKY